MERGFTLLEMLAAVAVFAVMAAMAYGSLNTLVREYRQNEAQIARLAGLQRTMSMLASDFTQALPRGVREEFHGDPVEAFLAGDDKAYPLELTRGGWSNPGAMRRATLQRVAWRVDDERLLRFHWPLLDRAPQSPAVETPLLEDVERVSWRLLDRSGEWRETWPPPDRPEGVRDELPVAVELTLDLRDWGRLTRIFVVK